MWNPQFEGGAEGIRRFKVDGGYIYESYCDTGLALCFVPDVDLQRYQAHLRDVYTQGYKDGQEDFRHGVVKMTCEGEGG